MISHAHWRGFRGTGFISWLPKSAGVTQRVMLPEGLFKDGQHGFVCQSARAVNLDIMNFSKTFDKMLQGRLG